MRSFLNKQKKMIKLQLLHRFATDTARGMKYLHSRVGIVQRDLKSQNLLIDGDNNVKVGDFGLSRKVDTTNNMTACGTPYWTAPEVVRGEIYDQRADVYSFAIILWELITLSEPYKGRDPLEIAFAVADEGLRPKIPFVCPEEYSKLMQDCWAVS